MKRLVLAAFVLPLSAAVAASDGDFRFDYSPQALATPEGVAALHARLKVAADAYCRDRYTAVNVHQVLACSRGLMKDTIKQISDSRLADRQEVMIRQQG